jgi:hypothetical protein
VALVAMAVGAFPPMEGYKDHLPRGFMHTPRPSNFHPSSFIHPPETTLFLAMDLHCRLQNMDYGAHAPLTAEDKVVYYMNRDFAGWVEQRVRRRVYSKLKLECTRNRSQDVQKTWEVWLCLYYKAFFPSKLRLTDYPGGGLSVWTCGL